MDDLFRDFLIWLVQFACVAAGLLVGARLLGRALRTDDTSASSGPAANPSDRKDPGPPLEPERPPTAALHEDGPS